MTTNSPHKNVRTEFTRLLRRLYTGRITNDEFDEAATLLVTYDNAVDQVYRLAAWPSYDDTREYRFVGRDALSREARREVARWMLFLKSGQPYAWPPFPHLSKWFDLSIMGTAICLGGYLHGWSGAVLGFLFSLGPLAYGDNFYGQRQWAKLRTAEDRAVWPFASKADYEAALKNPPYLCGIDRRT